MRAVFSIAGGVIKELIRKKDFYVLLIFMLVLLGFLAQQQFFQIEGVSRYMTDLGYTFLMLFSFVIAVTFTARQLPGEIDSKTIYPLLAKPISRYTVIAGKFTGGAVVASTAFTVFYLIFSAFYLASASVADIPVLLQGYLLGVLFLCLSTALVVFFSTFLTLSANVTLAVLLYMGIGGFASSLRETVLFSKGAASAFYGFVFYLLPHFEFFDVRIRLTHGWGPLPFWAIMSVIGYTILYCAALLSAAGGIFGRKRL